MNHDDVPTELPARTGKHICTNCLREVAPDEYFGHDLVCGDCASQDEYPLASTTGESDTDEADSSASDDEIPPRKATEGC